MSKTPKKNAPGVPKSDKTNSHRQDSYGVNNKIVSENIPETSRMLTHKGISFNLLYYNSKKLQEILITSGQCRIQFRYDPTDLSAIYIKDGFPPVEFSIPAINQKYARELSLPEHLQNLIIAKDKKDVDRASLIKVKKKIKELVMKDAKRLRNR
jgi:hypothetical protein